MPFNTIIGHIFLQLMCVDDTKNENQQILLKHWWCNIVTVVVVRGVHTFIMTLNIVTLFFTMSSERPWWLEIVTFNDFLDSSCLVGSIPWVKLWITPCFNWENNYFPFTSSLSCSLQSKCCDGIQVRHWNYFRPLLGTINIAYLGPHPRNMG